MLMNESIIVYSQQNFISYQVEHIMGFDAIRADNSMQLILSAENVQPHKL